MHDFLPIEKFHFSCTWARGPILAVMRAIGRSPYFHFAESEFQNSGKKYKVVIRPGSRSSYRYTSELLVEMGHYHVRITIQSREDVGMGSGGIRFTIHKEWRRGYPNRPKWRKFGTYASLLLKQHHVLKDIEHVMES
jgi:hypothetical protein